MAARNPLQKPNSTFQGKWLLLSICQSCEKQKSTKIIHKVLSHFFNATLTTRRWFRKSSWGVYGWELGGNGNCFWSFIWNCSQETNAMNGHQIHPQLAEAKRKLCKHLPRGHVRARSRGCTVGKAHGTAQRPVESWPSQSGPELMKSTLHHFIGDRSSSLAFSFNSVTKGLSFSLNPTDKGGKKIKVKQATNWQTLWL